MPRTVAVGNQLDNSARSRIRPVREKASTTGYEARISQLEQALTRLEKQNQDLLIERDWWRERSVHLEQAPLGYLILNPNGVIQDINAAGAEMLGQSKEKLLHKSLFPFLTSKGLPLFLAHLKRCKSSTRKVQSELFLRDAEKEKAVDFLSVRRHNPQTGRLELRTFIIDAGQRHAATQAIFEKQRDYEMLLSSLDGTVWEMDPDTQRFTFVSDHAERLLGFSSQWWIDELNFWERHLHPDDRERVVAQRTHACLTQEGYVCEYRMRTADKRIVWLKDSVHLHKDADGCRLRGITVNVTVLKEIQTELQSINAGLESRIRERTMELEESLRSMESFCYSIAHDLRAPARAMEGFATALMEDYEAILGADGKEYTYRIIMASRRMDELIGDLLAYGQILHRDIPCVDVDLNVAVKKVVNEVAAEIELTGAKVRVAPNLPTILAHESVLHQVLTNLMTNALKFVAPEKKPEVSIRAEERKGFVRVWVEDNGIGIMTKHLERIFHVFERLHCNEVYSGTGIGLALVKKGVERMGGNVGVESEPEKGSRFWIELRKPGRKSAETLE